MDHLQHQDALALIGGAEVVALPSYSEGLPRMILEAVALGRKVICPPGIPEFERHLPSYLLLRIQVDCIVRTLDAVWRYDGLPRYPLLSHSLPRVVEALVDAYSQKLADGREALK